MPPKRSTRPCALCSKPTARASFRYCSQDCANASKRGRFAERFWAKVDRSGGPDACWPWLAGRHRRGYGKYWLNGRTIPANRVAWELVNGPMPTELRACHSCDNPPCCNPRHIWPGTDADNQADSKAKGRTASGERHWSHQVPEKLARGDAHWTRTRPERLARGDRNGARIHPDRVARGDRSPARRHPGLFAGERNGKARLTAADVREIRRRYGDGELQVALARAFGVPQTQISRIVRGKAWAHVV
jgi:hypothetical protein